MVASLVAEPRLRRGAQKLQLTDSRAWAQYCVAYRPSCLTACGVFPDQGLNLRPPHWQVKHPTPGPPGESDVRSPDTSFLQTPLPLCLPLSGSGCCGCCGCSLPWAWSFSSPGRPWLVMWFQSCLGNRRTRRLCSGGRERTDYWRELSHFSTQLGSPSCILGQMCMVVGRDGQNVPEVQVTAAPLTSCLQAQPTSTAFKGRAGPFWNSLSILPSP